MVIKLWVDDIRPAPEGWHWAETVTEAIRILDTAEVTELSLDHDISYKVSIGHGDPRPFCSPETFEPVARFIAMMLRVDAGELTCEFTLKRQNGGKSFTRRNARCCRMGVRCANPSPLKSGANKRMIS